MFGKERNNLLNDFYREDNEYTNKIENTQDMIRQKSAMKRKGYQTAPVVFTVLLSLTVLSLSVPGMIFGWVYLNRIRKAPGKPNWLPAMIAALLIPCFLLWLIPWFFGIQAGVMIARDFDLPIATFQFLGGLAAFFFSLLLIITLIWLTYRWGFPNRKKRTPSQEFLKHGKGGLPLAVLCSSLLLYGIGMALFIPPKLAMIPFQLELGYAKAGLELFQSTADSNKAELRYLQSVASDDDPRLVVRLAREKINALILAEHRKKLEEKQEIFEEAQSKQTT